jgi:SAM-dependent methyltransferase
MAENFDPKSRFSERAAYYARNRPRYPEEILRYLERELSFSRGSIVADVGSGTGIFSEMLLKNGNTVFGIEPNQDMRAIAEARLSAYPNFRSINGAAESTRLPDASVDLITAAQSFHWFDQPRTKAELQRILRRSGWVVLVWNNRRTTTPFLQAYDELLREAPIIRRRVRHEDIDEKMLHSFLGEFREVKLSNFQDLDYEGLVGRLLSASYAPLPGEPHYDRVIARLREIFDRYETDGQVRFEYETELYAGKLS